MSELELGCSITDTHTTDVPNSVNPEIEVRSETQKNSVDGLYYAKLGEQGAKPKGVKHIKAHSATPSDTLSPKHFC